MSNTFNSLRSLNDKLKLMKESISNKIDRNTKQLPINELNIGGSIILGTMGDIMELLTLATPNKHGIMSMDDKKKLDGIEDNANNYIHPTTHSADMIVENDGKMFISKTEKEYLHNHTHDDRYYTETEIDSMLAEKPNLEHNHDDRYYTETEMDNLLSGKANVEHGNHVPTYENTPVSNMRFLHASGIWSDVSASLLNTYTKEEISGLFTQFAKNLDWKESVDTRADLETTYPNPEDGWTVNVKDDNYTYRWDGSKWAVIGGNAYVHPSTHPASMITTDSTRMFVTQAQIDAWNAKANANHGHHIPAPETAVANKFLRNDNTWQPITPATIGALPSSGKAVDSSKLNGVANSTGASANTIAQRDSAGDINVRLVRSNYSNETRMVGAVAFRVNTSDNYIRFCSDTNAFRTWLSTYSKSEIDSKLGGKANSSHGNHVPATESANNARFLRNDNTWQTVTPGNIGTYTKSEIDNKDVTVRNGVYGSQQVGGAYTGGGGKQPPSFVGSGRVRFLMSNEPVGSDTGYKDWIYMDTYSGGDVPSTTAFGISKSDTIRAFLMRGAKGGSSWNRKAEIWHSVNFNPGTKFNVSGGDVTGKLRARKAVGSRPDYHTCQIELNSAGGSNAAGIGFHREGSSAHSLQLRDDYLGISVIAQGTGLGNLRAGTINASKVYNAVWNDYAELFPKLQSSKTEPGDIISLNLDTGKEYYCKATKESSSFIVGVHSDEFGILIGGEVPNSPHRPQDNYEFNKDHFIPVGLAGRVRAKCIGIIKRGDKLVISEDFPGVARAFNPNIDNPMDIFGMAVENKTNPDTITRVRMFIK